jgi:5-methylcytosine-specific restriction endonuclease McrBC GTP-binding regulatory subunit McrB
MGQNNPIKAKGVYLYSLQEFEEDFGMKFTHLRNKTERLQLYDIVLKIFTLKTYNQPLSEIEMRLYNENAIRKQ